MSGFINSIEASTSSQRKTANDRLTGRGGAGTETSQSLPAAAVRCTARIFLVASGVTGQSLSPMVWDRGIAPGPNVGRSADARGIGNHKAGSGRPVTTEA